MREKSYWLFDLDNTLYPPACGLFAAIDGRINRYLEEFFGVSPDRVDAVRKGYLEKYGLTLVGLMRERGADPHHYLEYVHRVPVGEYLGPNEALRGLLGGIAAPKAIFTNGSRRHALAVLGALGVGEYFDGIFDIADLGFVPKPDPRSYRRVLDSLGVPGHSVVLVEDLQRNLAPARELGMTTVLVGAGGGTASADYAVDTLEELAGLLAGLPG